MNPNTLPEHTFAPGLHYRGIEVPQRLADFRLIAFDMDSTLINIECIDELADAAGRKAEVAAITEAAMRGEIADYKESLRRRVSLLAGVPAQALEEVYQHRLRLNPGARELVEACQAAELRTLLVSGGFTYFTDRVRDTWSINPGAIFATARKSVACCNRPVMNWASRRARPLPWAMGPTTCR